MRDAKIISDPSPDIPISASVSPFCVVESSPQSHTFADPEIGSFRPPASKPHCPQCGCTRVFLSGTTGRCNDCHTLFNHLTGEVI
jgi:hypothetical protein